MTSSKTLITFVLDETGSMQPIKDDTIGGFNEFLGQLRKQDADARFTLIKFDSERQAVVHRAAPLAAVPELTDETYQPGAATPLIDACMKGIETAEGDAGKDTRVSIVIQTDGCENASHRYRNSDLAAKVKEKENLGWMFTFLGAGMDAFAQADQFGIGAEHTMRYGRDKSMAAFRGVARRSCYFMESGEASDFTAQERDAARDDDDNTSHGRAAGRQERQTSLFDAEA